MSDPNLVHSGRSRQVTVDGHNLKIEIYRLEDCPEWSLEVVDEDGTSTVWDNLFETDEAAINEALKTIDEEGLSAFRDNGNVVPFPST